MYYRYEARRVEINSWVGAFALLEPDQRRFAARSLREPKWYQLHPGIINTRCWFTEFGYQKHHAMMESLLKEAKDRFSEYGYEWRLVKKDEISDAYMRGKVQVIEKMSLTTRQA